jgi:hypothetical protein
MVDPVRVRAKGLEGCASRFVRPPGLEQQDRRIKEKFRKAALVGEVLEKPLEIGQAAFASPNCTK